MAFFRSRDRRDNTQRADDLLAGARALYEAGRHAEAEAEARSVAAAVGRHPDDLAVPMAVSIAALAASAQGRHEEALAETKSAGVLDRAFTRAERAQETGLVDLNEAMALFSPRPWPSSGWTVPPRPVRGLRPATRSAWRPSGRTIPARFRPARCSTASTAPDRVR
ncbi:hypothetical protein VR44_29280, partial [Streptomyces katrae]